jgi:hypothetical protein
MSATAILPRESTHAPPVHPVTVSAALEGDRSDVLTWLEAGKLILLDRNKEAVTPETWNQLPSEARSLAEAEFDKVVRGSTKAAVIFLH